MITNETINHAIDYILHHINEELSVGDVAAHCHFSKYHFSRMFKEETGESVYAFIRRLKLEQSAFRLKIEPDRAVTDIGYEFGYSPSNYSWMFRQQYQTTPVHFRRNCFQATLHHPFMHMESEEKENAVSKRRTDSRYCAGSGLETFEECSKKIEIKTLPDYYVLYERRIGSYRHLSGQWQDFMEKYRAYVTDDTQYFERTFDDPAITAADRCLYDICMSVDRDLELENTCTIEGGRCAVYAYKGLGKYIYAAYQTIFNIWLPRVPYELDYRSGFDIYHRVDGDSGYMELEICLPLKSE
ncbi:MAG: AraC family transcriptional regulator [Lachnospiraceae bacterium]|nr:AraC family transcriptional regulator [Lachnospiraceae bacterium]